MRVKGRSVYMDRHTLEEVAATYAPMALASCTAKTPQPPEPPRISTYVCVCAYMCVSVSVLGGGGGYVCMCADHVHLCMSERNSDSLIQCVSRGLGDFLLRRRCRRPSPRESAPMCVGVRV